MDEKQKTIACRLEKLLNAADDANLMGGVYEGSFCLWPINKAPLIRHNAEFFDAVEEHGIILLSRMGLDGGAGI